MQGILGVETFQKVVKNVGVQLNLNEEHIEGILLNASVEKDTFQIRDFKGGMEDQGSLM